MIIENEKIGIVHYGIWQLTESVEELQALIGNRFQVDLSAFSHEARQKERLASRLLIEALCGQPEEIAYEPSGKPYFAHRKECISISHTKGYVAVAIAAFPVGIDIEYTSDRVLRIQKKFLSKEELQLTQELLGEIPAANGNVEPQPAKALENALLFWCTKEACFKKMEEANPDFTLIHCQRSDNQVAATFGKEHFLFRYKITPDYCLVLG